MKSDYITGYTGATEADGFTPFVSINHTGHELEKIAQVILRNRKGDIVRVNVPLSELVTMANQILLIVDNRSSYVNVTAVDQCQPT